MFDAGSDSSRMRRLMRAASSRYLTQNLCSSRIPGLEAIGGPA